MKIFSKILFSLSLFSIPIIEPLEGSWSAPVPISGGISSLSPVGPPAALDSNSLAVAGWLDGQITMGLNDFSSTLPVTSTFWTSPQLVATVVPPTALVPPDFGLDHADNQYIFWVSFDATLSQFTFNTAHRPPGATLWSPTISLLNTGVPRGATLGVGNLGNVFAITGSSNSGGSPPFDIMLSTLPAGDTQWTTPLTLGVDTSMSPTVAGSIQNAKGVFGWKVMLPQVQVDTARYNVATNQAVPASSIVFPTAPVDIVALQIVVKNDNAIAVIGVYTGAGFELYSSTLLAGQLNWSAPLLISNPVNNVMALSLDTDPFGNAVILWAESINSNHLMVLSTNLPLGGLPTPTAILADVNATNVGIDSSMKVAIDSFGNDVAIWALQLSGSPNAVQVSSRATGQQNWSAPLTLSSSGSTPYIVLNDQETAVAIWVDGVTTILMGSRNLAVFPLVAPTNFIGEVFANRFLTQTEYALHLQWTSSLAPNTGYEIRKNGVLIATVPPGVNTYVVHNEKKHIKGSYTLTAIASNGNVSIPIPLTLIKN